MYCRIYCINLSGLTDRKLDSINRSSCRFFFCRIFQLNPSPFDVKSFMFCFKYKMKKPSHVFYVVIYAVCMNLLWDLEVFAFIHTWGFQSQDWCRELGDHFSCCIKSLKIHKWEYLCLLWIQERNSPWTQSCHVVVIVSFLLEVAIGC